VAAHPAVDGVLTRARSHAATGEWELVRRLLRAELAVAREHPELVTLRGEAELRTGNPRDARSWLREMLPRVEASGDRAALRRAVNQIGVAEVELGALDDAEGTLGWALELGRRDGDDLLVARATNNLGAIANIRGQRAEALALYQLAIPAYQRLGHQVGLAESLHNMAISFRDLGQLEAADECERRALEYARDAGAGPLLALARLGRAELALRAGYAGVAEVGARRAAGQFAGLPDQIREADALRVVGAAAAAQGKTDAAADAIDRALTLARTFGSSLTEAEALHVRATVRRSVGDESAARADAETAIAIYERLGAVAARQALLDWLSGSRASS
jgi:tetratricopeptide (TPR) repeat protein